MLLLRARRQVAGALMEVQRSILSARAWSALRELAEV